MWLTFALLGAFSAAVVVTLSKAGIKNMDSNLAFAIQSVLILLVSWSVVFWQGSLPELGRVERRTWIYLTAAGIITCLSSLFTFRALKLANASVVSPVERISLVFAIVLAAIFLKEKISWQLVTGAILMTAGAILIALSGYSAK